MSADKFSNSENPAWIAAQRALQKIGAETDSVVNGGMGFTPPVGFSYNPHYQPYYPGINTPGHSNIQAGFPPLDLSLYNSQKPNLSFVKPKLGSNLGKVQYQARATISKGPVPPSVQNTVSEISQPNFLGNKTKTFFQNGTQAPGVPTIKFNPTKKPVGLLLPSQLANEDCDYPLISKVSHPPLRNYIFRAFKSLPNPNQKHKLLSYLEERVTPLIESGATKAVNWDSEPLPHEVGFTFESFGFSKAPKRPAPPVNMPAKKSLVNITADSNFTGPDILLSGAKVTKNNKNKYLKDDQLVGPVADKLKEKRAKRFASEFKKNSTISPIKFLPTNDSSPIYFSDTKGNNSYKFSEINMDENFVGTSTELERRYLRLTERPRPDQVRPEAVLKKSIRHVLNKYYKTRSYDYAGGQLKSIRQDLCVQNIRNPFAIYVYEECAKVAIENGDKEEFNQSQQQLRQLYSLNPNTNNESDFFGYNLLFLLYTNNPMDINKWMQNLTRDKKNNKVVRFALGVFHALKYKIYPQFFELYHQAPDATSKHLINIYLDRERCNALKIILSAYQVYIPLEVISENLRYEINELREWLKAKDIETVPNKDGKEVIECKKYINNAFK